MNSLRRSTRQKTAGFTLIELFSDHRHHCYSHRSALASCAEGPPGRGTNVVQAWCKRVWVTAVSEESPRVPVCTVTISPLSPTTAWSWGRIGSLSGFVKMLNSFGRQHQRCPLGAY